MKSLRSRAFKYAILALCAAAALCAASCAQPTNAISETGTIKLALTTLVDEIAAGKASSDASSRAIVRADNIVLTLLNADGTEKDTKKNSGWNYSLFTSLSDSGWEVPVGANYTLRLDVFNSAVSDTIPTVSGTSAPFDVTAGAYVPVSICCVPVAATPLTQGTACDSFALAKGGERWLRFTAASTITTVSIAPTTDSEFNYCIYDGEGIKQNSGYYYSYGLTNRNLVTIAGANYYLAIYAPTENAFSVTANDFFIVNQVTALTIGSTATNASLGSATESDYFTLPVTANLTYHIAMTYTSEDFYKSVTVYKGDLATVVKQDLNNADFSFTATETGTYYIKVASEGGIGPYTIAVTEAAKGIVTVNLAGCDAYKDNTLLLLASDIGNIPSIPLFSSTASITNSSYSFSTTDQVVGSYYVHLVVDMDSNAKASIGDYALTGYANVDGNTSIQLNASDFREIDSFEVNDFTLGLSEVTLASEITSTLLSDYDLDLLGVSTKAGKSYTVTLTTGDANASPKLEIRVFPLFMSSPKDIIARSGSPYSITFTALPYDAAATFLVSGQTGSYKLKVVQND